MAFLELRHPIAVYRDLINLFISFVLLSDFLVNNRPGYCYLTRGTRFCDLDFVACLRALRVAQLGVSNPRAVLCTSDDYVGLVSHLFDQDLLLVLHVLFTCGVGGLNFFSDQDVFCATLYMATCEHRNHLCESYTQAQWRFHHELIFLSITFSLFKYYLFK
jgi:hypothetical protein